MSADRRSPLSVVVLTLLAERAMHPYQMQQLIKERAKDRVANVAQRNSVYQAIRRLEREGLIRVLETTRDERRPERTTYEITREGRRTIVQWLREMLSRPAREFPLFPAALASMLLLKPADVRASLERRAAALEADLTDRAASSAGLPRVFVIEEEYAMAVGRAELEWVRGVVGDLDSGALEWSEAGLRAFAASIESQSHSGLTGAGPKGSTAAGKTGKKKRKKG